MHKLVNANAEELASASREDLIELVKSDALYTADRLHEFATRQCQHEREMQGALWSAYNYERGEWMKTMRACLAGGHGMTEAMELATRIHGDLPEKPKT